jgi:hypothetical protein
VVEKIGAGTYQLQNLRGEHDALPMNGQALKRYFDKKKRKKKKKKKRKKINCNIYRYE